MPESMKIVCYNCAQKLDVTEFSPFSKLPCPICASELIIPKIFGNFLLEEDFGLGYTGQLYRSMDRTLDREVAIRVLPINTDDSEKEEERFNRHAKAISSLTNPSIVPIYSCGMMEEQPYLAMQFMTGGNLVNRLNRKNDFTQLLIWFKSTIHALNLADTLQ